MPSPDQIPDVGLWLRSFGRSAADFPTSYPALSKRQNADIQIFRAHETAPITSTLERQATYLPYFHFLKTDAVEALRSHRSDRIVMPRLQLWRMGRASEDPDLATSECWSGDGKHWLNTCLVKVTACPCTDCRMGSPSVLIFVAAHDGRFHPMLPLRPQLFQVKLPICQAPEQAVPDCQGISCFEST